MPEASAQAKAWVMGNQLISFDDPGSAYQTTALPIYPGGYQGQVAQRNQAARIGPDGELEIFMVDGAVFDGDGALIADNLSPGCTQCIPKGCTKALIIPIPTGEIGGSRCGMYYIITSNPSNLPGQAGAFVGILDMNAPNAYDPARRGRMVNLAYEWSDPSYGNFYDSFSLLTGTWQSDYMVRLPASIQGQKGGWIELAAIDPKWISGPNIGYWLLHVTFADRIIQYYLGPNGITEHWTLDVGTNSPGNDQWAHQSQFGYSPFSGECYFAATQDGSWDVPNAQPSLAYPLIVLRLAANTGDIETNTGYNLDGSPEQGKYVYGCAFDEQSFRLFYTRGGGGTKLGVLDLTNGQWTDLESYTGLGITGAAQRIYTHIEPNVSYNGGAPNTLLYAHAGGISALTVPNALDPGTWTWTGSVPFTQTLNIVPLSIPNWSDPNPPRLLNGQMINDPLLVEQGDRCCAFTDLVDAPVSDIVVTGTSNVWSPGNNGLPGNPQEAEFMQDLVVEEGAQLAVQNMTMRFSPEARIVVKRGGYVRFTNCELTSANCEGARWRGIRIYGWTDRDQLPMINGDQGYVLLNGTTVSNAEVGAICAMEQDGQWSAIGYGGILRCFNSRFRNCLSGAQVSDYHANLVGGVENNLSGFYNTRFSIDGGWPDDAASKVQLAVRNTRHVDVNYCRFSNDALTTAFANGDRGMGLMIDNAQTTVQGNPDPSTSYIRGFNIGLLNTLNAYTAVTVRNMEFRGNNWGIADFGSLFARYTGNHFIVPDQGTAASPRVGLLLWQTQLMTVERNTFLGEDPAHEAGENTVGMFHLGYNAALATPDEYDDSWLYVDNRIYDNVFNDLTVGNLVQWVNRGSQADENSSGLQILCGDYTNNIFDHAVLEGSLIKAKQGLPGGQLGGNRYFDQADCLSSFDWWLNPAWNVVPNWFPGMTITYLHHEQPIALVDPNCTSPYYSDAFDPFSGVFDKPISCGGGILDGMLLLADVKAALATATQQWTDARAALDGLVGAADERDVLDAIYEEAQPWSSSALRNLLLASSPVSDGVLEAAINRFEPLNPWHLTQVMTENSPLNPGIYRLLENSGQLSAFYWNTVVQAQQGQGPSTKQQLEAELGLRHEQRALAIADLGWRYGTDTIMHGSVDSLRVLVMNEADEAYGYARLAGRFAQEEWADIVSDLSGSMGKTNGHQVYRTFGMQGQALAGDWSALSGGGLAEMLSAEQDGRAGAAWTAGLLKAYGYSDWMPPVRMPNQERAMRVEVKAQEEAAPPKGLQAAPNPTDGLIYLSVQSAYAGAMVELIDATGRAVLRNSVPPGLMMELDLRTLPPGLYRARIPGTSEELGLSVAR